MTSPYALKIVDEINPYVKAIKIGSEILLGSI